MNGSDRPSHRILRIIAVFIIVISILWIPVACDNGGGGGGDKHSGNPPGTENDWAQDLASGGAGISLMALTEAAEIPVPEFLIEDIIGLTLGKLFKGGPSPDQEILDGLNEINTELQAVETELADIAGQLTALENALQIDTDELDKEIRTAEMDPYVNQIDTLYDEYLGLHSTDAKGNDIWDTNPADLASLASDVLNIASGAYPQLVGIHNLLTGEGDVSGSTLDAMLTYATALVINGKQDPFESYMMIENYFGSILQAQTHGATLMVEALKYREANPQQTSPEDYLESAEYFMGWYTAHIEDQVEVFLEKTEQFVTMTAYPQQGFANFVPEADKIFYRADLIAAWLSSRHRLDPSQPPKGQQFMVYRVIGGPDRVGQYGNAFTAGTSKFTSILYNQTNTPDQYGLATYQQTSHHAYSGLRSGTSPYVQFMHPLDNNGGAKQKGAISDAAEIWTGKYVTKADKSGNHSVSQPYYLSDIPGYTTCTVQYQYVNSAGSDTSAATDDQILFGYCLDIQHPTAMLMGDWEIVLSHDSQSGLQSGLAHWLNGNPTPGSQSVYLGVDAWPTVTHDQYWYYPTGNFQQENAMVGNYYWGGSTCCPHLSTNYTASMAWNIQNNGAPADRDCGTLLWVARADQNNSYGDYNYNSVGSGTDSGIQGSVTIDMVPGEAFYASLGAHMFVDWSGNNVSSDADWHHWQGNYTLTLQELHFTLPQ